MNIFKQLFRVAVANLFLSCSRCFECGLYNTNMGSSFDLRDVSRSPDEPSYIANPTSPCSINVQQSNFTYMFNICGVLAAGLPVTCSSLSDIRKAAAVRVDSSTNPSECVIAGLYSETSSKVQLLDQDDPTKGISVIYYGDYCRDPPSVQMKFVINMECSDKLNPLPTQAYESGHCEHKITIPSIYGCPLECPVTSRRLCGGNGHCHYDTDVGSAKCFCNEGYYGADCSSSSDKTDFMSGYTSALMGLIVTLLVIIGVLVGGVVVLVRQISAFKEDVENYRALQDDDNNATREIVL